MCEVRCWLPDDKSVFLISWNLLTLPKYWVNVYPPLWSQEWLLHRVGTCLFVCLRCGFCSPHLESFQLLVCVICIKLMKEVSVKSQVFVKPFLNPQTFWLFGDSCLRIMQERDGKSPCWPVCPAERSGSALPEMSVGVQAWSDEKEFSQGIEGEQEKVLFHMTSYKWVWCLFFAGVQSWVSASRPESSPQAHWNGNGFALLLWNANYFRNVPGSWGFLKLTLTRLIFLAHFIQFS